jgi:type III secretory pathway component EscS
METVPCAVCQSRSPHFRARFLLRSKDIVSHTQHGKATLTVRLPVCAYCRWIVFLTSGWGTTLAAIIGAVIGVFVGLRSGEIASAAFSIGAIAAIPYHLVMVVFGRWILRKRVDRWLQQYDLPTWLQAQSF